MNKQTQNELTIVSGFSDVYGQRVHDEIASSLREGKKIELLFKQGEPLVSSFLNEAIGRLFGEFSEESIRELVSVRGMDKDGQDMLKLVVANAKVYFERLKGPDPVWKGEAGENDDYPCPFCLSWVCTCDGDMELR